MLIVKLDTAVNCGMVHDAARKRLISVRAQIEILAQPCGDFRKVIFRGLDCRESAWTFQAMFARSEAGLCQQRCSISVLRGAARMQRLCHRSEHLSQSRGLGRGEPDRPDHLMVLV